MSRDELGEKGPYVDTGSPTSDAPAYDTHKRQSIGEAADVYGDIQTAEEYGYVTRGLKSRHIQFIALGKMSRVQV